MSTTWTSSAASFCCRSAAEIEETLVACHRPANRHPVMDVVGEELEPVAIAALVQRSCLAVIELLDLVLETHIYLHGLLPLVARASPRNSDALRDQAVSSSPVGKFC